MKKISVIIPAYNAAETIGDCLTSVLNNTFENLEIIVVNDGSTDRTVEIVKDYAVKDSRITLINKRNGGVSSARNTGIENSSGELLMFLDSDDTYTPDICRQLLENMDLFDSDISQCGYTEITTNYSLERYSPAPEFIDTSDDIFKLFISKVLFSGTNGFMASVWNSIYKKDIIIENKLCFREDIRFGEDSVFLVQYLLKCNRMSTIPKALYNYNLREESVTKKYSYGLCENNRCIMRLWTQIFSETSFLLTDNQLGKAAVSMTFSLIVNESRKNNPNRGWNQIINVMSFGKEYKSLIQKMTPDSFVLSIKKIISLSPFLSLCYFCLRKIQYYLGAYY